MIPVSTMGTIGILSMVYGTNVYWGYVGRYRNLLMMPNCPFIAHVYRGRGGGTVYI